MSDDLKRCRNCGQQKRKHGAADNPIRAFACPGRQEPPWPNEIEDEQRAGEIYDERLVRFWNERTTTFQER